MNRIETWSPSPAGFSSCDLILQKNMCIGQERGKSFFDPFWNVPWIGNWKAQQVWIYIDSCSYAKEELVSFVSWHTCGTDSIGRRFRWIVVVCSLSWSSVSAMAKPLQTRCQIQCGAFIFVYPFLLPIRVEWMKRCRACYSKSWGCQSRDTDTLRHLRMSPRLQSQHRNLWDRHHETLCRKPNTSWSVFRRLHVYNTVT